MISSRDIAAKIVDSVLDPKLKIEKSFDCGRVNIGFTKNGSAVYSLDNKIIHIFNSEAKTADKRKISTDEAKKTSVTLETDGNIYRITAIYEKDGLTLTQNISAESDKPYFKISVTLRENKKETKTNYIAPLAFIYPSSDCDPLFRSLKQKMLIVPYDNDMWVRYENAPLSPGRTSYDITVINDGMRGMVVGALDFDKWKNAVRCSAYDARVYSAFSGIADSGTHDTFTHGILKGEDVTSAEFFCGMFDDMREGLEVYGDCVKEKNPIKEWQGGVPFGWNSYSALMASLTTNHWKETADFFYEELPAFRGEDGSQYINLDASFGLSRRKKAKIIEECHKRGQKVGTYIAPLMAIPAMMFLKLKGSDKKKSDIILKKPDGSDYHTIDGSFPVDITIPEAEQDLRLSLREIVSDGYDYLKIDFLSHGALEGKRFDKDIVTGRQALMRFYEILWEELDPVKIGREIFVSLSIAPLFPSGFGHARRCCCDAFGHIEDTDYVLSSLRHGFWENGRLYKYADPDHTVLYNSVVDKRGETSENEAKLRYYASLISGTIMLLSDNYGPFGDKNIIENSRERTKLLANNDSLNSVARLGNAFRPLYVGEDCNAFYLKAEDKTYIAVFNLTEKEKAFEIELNEIKEGRRIKSLSDENEAELNGTVVLKALDCDIFEII